MQVGEYDGVVVRSRQQIVGADGEARGANLVRVRLERLDDTAASHVPQHARGVLVTGGQQPAGRLNAYRRKRAPYKNTRLYQHRQTVQSCGRSLPALQRPRPTAHHTSVTAAALAARCVQDRGARTSVASWSGSRIPRRRLSPSVGRWSSPTAVQLQ